MGDISKNFSWSELTVTNHNIPNIPNEDQKKNIEDLVINVLQPLRDLAGVSISVNSGFRSPAVNKKVGGASTSQHCANKGAAADLMCIKKSNAEIFKIIKDKLPFDQLIWEFGTDKEPSWVHVSYNAKNNRKQILKARKNTLGKTVYENI